MNWWQGSCPPKPGEAGGRELAKAMDLHHVPVGIGVWGVGNAAFRGLLRPDLGAVNDPHKRTIR